MLIAGGLYRETCEIPSWNALYGSGGRAAAAVARLSESVDLYTYQPAGGQAAWRHIEALGVRIFAAASAGEIAFAYFHPLSTPAIAPAPGTLAREAPLRLEGETVLRFGLLEGDAIVAAATAVYDPQCATGVRPFAENGSRADRLAIVLNDAELRASMRGASSDVAARQLMERDGAAVLVAKDGVKGARVYTGAGAIAHVPAYASRRVFKIGSGDVFSAVFTYYWGEAGLSGVEAADQASRATAHYCETRELPLPAPNLMPSRAPASVAASPRVYLAGSTSTIGSRWTLEEARWCLRALGADVVAPAVDVPAGGAAFQDCNAALVVADGLDEADLDGWRRAADRGIALVALQRADAQCHRLGDRLDVVATDDFATAIYLACWATAASRTTRG